MHAYRECLVEQEHTLLRVSHTISKMMEYLVQRFSQYLFAVKNAMIHIRQRLLFIQRSFGDTAHTIVQSFKYAQEQTALLLQHGEQVVVLNDPKRQLRLGYSIVKKENKIVRSVRDIVAGDSVNIMVSDGTVDAEVSQMNKN